MAVYFNLVVDCGLSAGVAERVRQRFDGHQFDHSPLAPLQCSAFTSQARGKWFAGVQPRGLGYGTIFELLDRQRRGAMPCSMPHRESGRVGQAPPTS